MSSPVPSRARVKRRLSGLLLAALLLAGCSIGADDPGIDQVTAEPGAASEPAPDQVAPIATTPPLDPADDETDTPTPVVGLDDDVRAEPDSAIASDASATGERETYSCLDMRAMAGQLVLPLLTEAEMAQAEPLAAAGDIGGIAFLGKPSPNVGAEISALQQLSPIPLLIASDEEGGEVQRFSNVLGPLPSAQSLAASESPAEVRERMRSYGDGLAEFGVDVVFGPVVDVGYALADGRSFSDQAEVVTEYGRAVAAGLGDAGITPVFKHFPGHGRASGDSHDFLPVTPSLDELRNVDLVPFSTLLNDPELSIDVGVMVAHLIVPGLTEDVPTSLSGDTVDGLLREELGFDGVVFTDALNMGAITNGWTTTDAVVGSIRAGSDVAILGGLSDVGPVVDRIVSEAAADPAFGQRLRESAARVLDAKGQAAICE